MSTRQLRVNELLQRELSQLLRRDHRDEAAMITITGVDVTPDIREGKVFVSITGDDDFCADRMRWLRRHARELRQALSQRVVLKNMPLLTYQRDVSTARGNRVLALLDEIQAKENPAEGTPPPDNG